MSQPKEDELILKHGGTLALPPSFALSQVRHIVRALLPYMQDCKTPINSKKGDVFQGTGVNGKPRPFVIVKVVKDGVYAIPLTTQEDEYTLISHDSRFMKPGFLANQLVFVKDDHVKKHFVCTFDDSRSLNKAAKLITDRIKKEFR